MNNNGVCTNCPYYFNNTTIGQNPNTTTTPTVQYDGFTTPIRATSALQCGKVYHIKLAIANTSDNQLDSGVFIKNFAITPLELFDNYGLMNNSNVCYGDQVTLFSGLVVGSNVFEWTKDNVVIPGETGNSLTINTLAPFLPANVPIEYALYVYTPYPDHCLIATDDITITFLPEIAVTNPTSLNSCTFAPPPYTFNINQTNAVLTDAVLGTPLDPNIFEVSYYNSNYQDAFDGVSNGLIPDATLNAYIINSNSATIWIRIRHSDHNCVTVKPFTLNVVAPPTGMSPQVFDTMNDIYLSDIVVSGTDVVWFASFDNAISNTNPLAPSTVLESGMTYYAVSAIDVCNSAPLAIVVTINLANTNFDLVGLEYYLNPMLDILNISYTQKIDSVRIYNIIGQQIKSIKPNASALQIDLSTYSFGTYILKIELGSKSKVIKVIRN